MARGRTFEWHGPDGRALLLSDRSSGFTVLEGVKGLGKPNYVNTLEDNAINDGVTPRGARAATRQVFLPMDVIGLTRVELLDRLQYMGQIMNPKDGVGQLYVVDGGQTYRLNCVYKEGMEGDESRDLAGESDGVCWQKTSITLDAIDPYFEDTTLLTSEYGYGGDVSFFAPPFFPLKLNASQVLSDIAQPARNNFILNPSAETNASNWTNTALGSTPSVIARSAIFAGGFAPYGDWVFQINASAAAANVLAFPDLASGGAPFVIGQTYTFHGRIYVPSGEPDVQPQIFFGGVAPTITTKDAWVWFKLTFVATSTGASDRAVLSMIGPTSSANLFYADGLAVTEGTILTPDEYIDGDQLYSHWSGTAHASQSFQDPLFEPAVINNPGTVETYPIIQVIGPGDSFIAENSRTGRRLTAALVTPLGSGQVATFNFKTKTAILDDGTNLYRYLTEDDFWPLLPGDNAVRFAVASASAGSKVIVVWNPRYEAIVA